MSEIVTAAKTLAWTLYIRDVQERINAQQVEWDKGNPTYQLLLTVPSSEKVNVMIAALTAATDDGIHQAVGRVIDFVDGIDNGDDKHVAAVKRLRKDAQQLLGDLRGMQSASYAVAK